VKEGVAPQSLNHFNRLRAVKVTGTLAPGYAIDEALVAMNDAAKRVLPNTAQTDLDGQSREFKKSGGEIYFTFVLALLFIYLVLSAQFESFVHPFVIMLSVPLSMTGALFMLWLTGGTLNIYSQVGLVTLVGLITKHGILIVEFSNQLRAKGEPLLRSRHRFGNAAPAPHPHDHRCDGAGRRAACAGDGGWGPSRGRKSAG
jgi:multidrug efflux pump